MENSNLGVDPRFRVIRELGGGAQSRVVEIHDRFHNERGALKIATQRGQIRRYRQEFQRLTELHHPHIIRAFDFGITHTRRPYFTMQLVEGLDLGHFNAEPAALGVLAIQILDALATIHLRGWVHRDVKPQNLLVVGEGTGAMVRLVDFGLLARAGVPTTSAGTLPYMAPEVSRGEAIDGRADLYSLGMVLYEALLPHDVPRTLEDIAHQHKGHLAAPNHINPVIPAGLSDFVMQLIEPNPNNRFPDAIVAADVLSRKKGLRLSQGPKSAAAERLLRGGAVSHRSRQIRSLRRTAGLVQSENRGAVVSVVGGVGCGKTPFLRDLSTQLNLDGMRVLRLHTTDRPGSPLGALLRIARELETKPTTPTPRLLGSRAHLSDVSAFAGQVATSLAGLGDRPTALLVDDLHLAAPVVLAVLRSLAARLNKLPLLLVCAAEQTTDSESFTTTLANMGEVITLGPLSQGEINALARHRLVGMEIPKPALARLSRESQGMPSLVEHTLARLLCSGAVQKSGATFEFKGGSYQAASHGDLAKILVDKAKPNHLQILWATAVVGHDIDATTAAAIAEVASAEAGSTLATLARLEILKPSPAVKHPRFSFANHHVLAEVYQRIPPDVRMRMHDRAADVVHLHTDSAVRLNERVEHLLKGSHREAAVEAAVEAGDRAASLYADRRAIEYYRRALATVGNETREAAPIALKLARVFERVGELPQAVTWYRAVLAGASFDEEPISPQSQSGDRFIAIEATLGLGAVEYARGNSGETSRHANRALELLQAQPDSRLIAMAHRLQGLVATRIGDTTGALAILLTTLAELEKLDAKKEVIELLLDLARLRQEQGDIVQAVRCARQAQQRARAQNDDSALAATSTFLGRGFARAGRFRAARQALRHGLQIARQSGDQLRHGLVLRETGDICVRQGDLESALRHYQQSLELIRVCHARADESVVLRRIGLVRARYGDFRASLIALHTAFDLRERTSDMRGQAATALGLGHTYARLGDLTRAQDYITVALETGQSLSNAALTASARAILTWVEVRAGKAEDTHELFAIVDQLLGPLQDPADLAFALVYATRSALLLQNGEQARTLAEQLRSVVRLGRLGDFVPTATALRGEAAALLGELPQAMALLERCAMTAARLHLRPLEVEARAALAGQLGPTNAAASELTRAMELLRDMANAMPTAMAHVFLTTREAEQIRRDFHVHSVRILPNLS